MHSNQRTPMRTEVERVPRWLQQDLHDLCQPLTALECQLYLSLLPLVENGVGEADKSARVAAEQERVSGIKEALVECGRMMTMVRAMQKHIALQELGDGWDEEGADDGRYTALSGERSAANHAIGGAGERRRGITGPIEERFDRA